MAEAAQLAGHRRRVAWLAAALLAVAMTLVGRLARWQLTGLPIPADRPDLIPAARGNILDAHGHFLASSTVTYNVGIYHALLPAYYLPSRIGGNATFWTALAGNLVSPARGLFVYSPVLAFWVVGVALKVKHRDMKPLDYYLVTCVVLHWFAISSFPHWWGGTTFGPRFFTDMTPLFVYFLVPVTVWLKTLTGVRKPLMNVAVAVCVALSAFIHYRGASTMEAWAWNDDPVSVETHPERLWDWTDLPFLRGLM